MILRRKGRVLLTRRAGDTYASGQLCLPSGHLEQGESVLDAAVRETWEEVGITLDPSQLGHVLTIHQRNPDQLHTRIGIVFEPGIWDGEPVNREPGRCSEFVWADPDDLPDDMVPYAAAIVTAVQRRETFALNGWTEDAPATTAVP